MTGRKKASDKEGKKRRPKRPKQSDVLYNALFANSKERIIGLISDGIRELHKNAKSLLDDVVVLSEHERFTSSDFLLFTAAEELAKIYILIDMLRLDFGKKARLKRLCQAFYSHLLKSVYFRIISFPLPIRDMKYLQEIAEVEKQEYWPEYDYESGEPDIINLELLRRETSIYVDFDEYAGFWISPNPGISKANINSGDSTGYQEEIKAIFKRVEKALSEGCFDTDCLIIFHDVFSKREIGIGMPMNEISKIYKRFVKEVEKAGIKAAGKIEEENPLLDWPIYAVL